MPALLLPSELFTVGRACAGPLAVVLHQYDSGIEMLDQEMERCYRPRKTQSPGCHTSYHYGISGTHFHQYVLNANTAWGFGTLAPACPEPPCPPTPCQSCTGLTADQYNPDVNGNPPVLPALVAGPDGTANCGVLHVAVGNIFPTYIGGACCDPDPRAYRGLVDALAEIFTSAAIVPSQNTLLVHCGELICLDIDQLVADVLEAQIIVPPATIACNCTPTVAQLCETLDGVPLGAPATAGVTRVLGDDCQFHVLPVGSGSVSVVASDTATVNMSVVQAPVGLFTVSATVDTEAVLAEIATCSGPYETGDVLVNALDVAASPTTNDPSAIWVSDAEDPCPRNLVGVPFDAELPMTNVVLGSILGVPTWAQVSSPALIVTSFTNATATISPDTSDVWLYTGVGDYTVTLNDGTSKNNLWIKNVSTSILTIDAAVGTIDGVNTISLQGTVPAGYPFGNNGGETVHIVKNGANWYVI